MSFLSLSTFGDPVVVKNQTRLMHNLLLIMKIKCFYQPLGIFIGGFFFYAPVLLMSSPNAFIFPLAFTERVL